MFVSLTGKASIWLVDADILHENFEPLTGLFNRDGFYEKATTLLASRSRGDDRFLAIAVVNLDTFSLVGEFSGLTGSNRARVEIAARLRETARRDAVLAHIADSEFVIGDLFDSDDASALVERVRGTVSGSPSRLSASIGVVTTALAPLVQLPPHDVLDELLSIATNAMYESRKCGGNQVTYVRSPTLTVLDDPGTTSGSTTRSSPRPLGTAGDDVDEQSVDAAVAGHLGMKRRRQHLALPHRDDVVGGPAQHPHVGTDPLHPRRPDEHRVHRAVQPFELDVALEGVDLSTEGVAPHRHIDALQRCGVTARNTGIEDLAGQQDHSGARTVGGHAVGQPRPQRLEQFEFAQQVASSWWTRRPV